MEQSLSSEANSHSDTQEILRLLWNSKVHYRVHKHLPLVPILNQMNSVHSFSTYFPPIHSNIILPSTPCSCKCSLSFRFSNKILYAFLMSPMRSICPSHQIHLVKLVFSSLLSQYSHLIPCRQTQSNVVALNHLHDQLNGGQLAPSFPTDTATVSHKINSFPDLLMTFFLNILPLDSQTPTETWPGLISVTVICKQDSACHSRDQLRLFQNALSITCRNYCVE